MVSCAASDKSAVAVEAARSRIEFANQLRGVAALAVVWLHVGIHYWYGKGFVFSTLGLANPPVPTDPPKWASWSHAILSLGFDFPVIDLGSLGVALFFLISGFVVPISLRKLKPGKFLLIRVIRIFPVYILSMLLLALLWWMFAYFGIGGGRTDVTASMLIAQLLLVSDLFGWPPLDLVSWTLQIELKFYLVAALLYAVIAKRGLWGVLLFALAVVVAALVLRLEAVTPLLMARVHPNAPFVIKQQLVQLAFVAYIFAGYVLWLFWTRKVSRREALLAVTGLWGLSNVAMFVCDVRGQQLFVVSFSQLMALAIFVIAMTRWASRRNLVLDGLATISYPLYMVHLTVGWSALALLERTGLPSLVSLITALLVVVFVAWFVHLVAERPSLRLIERIK
jgi:peptidoglycan/LPS O-acetylase OafA/YrhL